MVLILPKNTLLILFIVVQHLSSQIKCNAISDLAYLGTLIFGKPNFETGHRLNREWHEHSPINPEELGGYAEGDILFPNTEVDDDVSSSRNGLLSNLYHWPNGTVPYEISPIYSSTDRATIQRAINIYHKYTCIKFRPRRLDDTDYLLIESGPSGCWSSVGRIGGRQVVNLQAPSCTTRIGTALHELMHALGFLHEHTRWERDDYVTISWNNIGRGHEGNFQKAHKETTDGYGVQYDYRSVMHYSPYAFSTNDRPTIIPKDSSKNIKMGQREGFSRGDILKINKMYGCKNQDPSTMPHEQHQQQQQQQQHNNNYGGGGGGGGGGLLNFLFQIVH